MLSRGRFLEIGLVLLHRVEDGWRRTLVVIYYVSKMVSTAVMGFSDAHGVVCEVDIAVVAWKGEGQYDQALGAFVTARKLTEDY